MIQEQAFNSLGGEQLTTHCNCWKNVECNNVSLWRVSHLKTLMCSYRCCTMLSYISNETPENVEIPLHTGSSRWTFINTLTSYSVSSSVLFS